MQAFGAFGAFGAIATIGSNAEQHRHWIFPVTHDEGDALIRHLAQQGFDAAYSASSLGVVAAPPGAAPAAEAARAFARLLYLPAHEGMSERDIEGLAQAIAAFERQRTPPLRNAVMP